MALQLKYPGENLAWMAPLVSVAATYLAYSAFSSGSTAFAVFMGILAVLTALVWFNQRWVAIPLVLFFSLTLSFSVISLFTRGITLGLVGRIVFHAYFLFELVRWARPTSYEPPPSLDPPDWRQM
jgi:hypothetical protein